MSHRGRGGGGLDLGRALGQAGRGQNRRSRWCLRSPHANFFWGGLGGSGFFFGNLGEEILMARDIAEPSPVDPEERANLHQRIGQLERENATMQIMRTDAGLNAAALEVARRVDDIFARGGVGVAQRTAQVQIVVRETMRKMLTGEKHWASSSDLRNQKEPS
jgi:hypothetical protein